MTHIQTDVLIIGCGIAGATAALHLAKNPALHITVVSAEEDPHESNTYYAQGGIIYRGDDDSPELLSEDIERAGAGLSNPRAVRVLAQEGPRLVREFLVEELRVPFDRLPNHDLERIKEAAHSTQRILHVGDYTGRAIQEKLVEALRACPNIELLTRHTAVDLLTPAHHSRNRLSVYDPLSCVGAYVFDQVTNKVDAYLAKKTILATGGLGRIFLYTTNPPTARGDGLAMAYNAGARIINAEYVQFHPTAFYYRDQARFLITEAVRGAGGHLVDDRGRPFMQKYNAEWKDLAPRDVVARSIHQEMLTTGSKCVYLDIKSYLPADEIKAHFPAIYQRCLEFGVDITKDLIPVVPAAHYHCGGVWVDEHGRSSLRNLYAIGEVSCTGVHGANRLGSASLLEGLVWGVRAARDIADNLGELGCASEDIPPWYNGGLTEVADPALIHQDMTTIQHIMWNYVGLVRSTRRLDRAISDLRNLQIDITRFYSTTKLTDGLIGLRNAVQAALIVAQAAWENKVSRGCHYRED
ncbi:MAG: L-aspartate oxidase [Anaerolineae bacterium]